MWLDELQLTDFRGFRHLKLDLRRQLTVVIGVNGAGKSSLVRAIEIGASHALQAVYRRHRAIELTHRDANGNLWPFCQAGVFWLTRQARKRPGGRG
jgi:recombinational DNA repair ATPase RecF